MAIAGRKGHVGTFDWHSGRLHTELHLKETVRAIRWLHDESFFAVAQKKYVYIYDKSGLEVHQLRNHIEVNQMEFLPYHFLLATIVSSLAQPRWSEGADELSCAGQRWLPQVPGHFDGTARSGDANEAGLVRDDGAEPS